MQLKKFIIAFLLFSTLSITTLVWSASPPSIITYQGKLLVSGSPASTTLSMQFTIYNASSGGTALYTASGTLSSPASINVTPDRGLFTVYLGGNGTNVLNSDIFKNNEELYLQVIINGETLTPRKRLASSPYALNSKYLDGNFATSSPTSTSYIPISDSSGNFNLNNITSTNIYIIGNAIANTVSATAFTLNGNTITSWPTGGGSLPSGTSGQLLIHNGTDWVASNTFTTTTIVRNILPDMVGGSGNVSLYSLGNSTSRFSEGWFENIYLGSSTWKLGQSNTGLLNIINLSTTTPALTINSQGHIGLGVDPTLAKISLRDRSYVPFTTTTVTTTITVLPPDNLQLTDWFCVDGMPPTGTTWDARIWAYKDTINGRIFSITSTAINTPTTSPCTGVANWSWDAPTGDTVDGYVINFYATGYDWLPYKFVTRTIFRAQDGDYENLSIDGPPVVVPTSTEIIEVVTSTEEQYGIDSLRLIYDNDNYASLKIKNTGTLIIRTNKASSGSSLLLNDSGMQFSLNKAAVSGDSSLTYVSTYNTVDGSAIYIRSMAVSGNNLFYGNILSPIVNIVNVSNPNNLSFSGSTTVSTGESITAAAISNNYVYSVGRFNFVTFDISNPSTPIETGSTSFGGRDIFISGDYAYLADDYYFRLNIINKSNPNNPYLAASTTFSTRPLSVYISGNYAYLISQPSMGSGRLFVVDISSPLSPVLVASTSWSGSAPNTLYISGNYVYTSNNDGSIGIINISNPLSPTLVATTSIDSNLVRGITGSGNFLFVVNRLTGASSTLFMLDITNPINPVVISTATVGISAVKVVESGGYLYISHDNSPIISVYSYLSNIPASTTTLFTVDKDGFTSNGYLRSLGISSNNYFLGNLGIGTSTVSHRLTVAGDVNITGQYLINGSPIGGGGSLPSGSVGQILVNSGGSNWEPTSTIFVSSSGFVGINNTNPLFGLELGGTATASRKLGINGNQIIYLPNQSIFNGSLFIGNGGQNLVYNSGLDGGNNTAVGMGALFSNTTGYDNTAIGNFALYSNTTGYDNTAIGNFALYSNTTGYDNTALGNFALYSNTTGNGNTALGYSALGSNTTGSGNTALGNFALRSNTTGFQNTALGNFALGSNTTGRYNTALGYLALSYNTTGNGNTALGYSALYSNTTGHYNTALGNFALSYNTTGYYNTALGYSALYSNATGSYNVAIGNNAGYDLNIPTNTYGYNTFIGYNTGRGIVTGVNNTILGAQVAGLPSNLSNNIIIADGSGNQRIRILDNGNVGVNTTTPDHSLTVSGSINITGQYLINGSPIGGGGSLPSGSIGQLLVNAGGSNWITSSVFRVDNTNLSVIMNDSVATGEYSAALGKSNTSSGSYSFVGGGATNTASGLGSFVGGGGLNNASGIASFVGAGGNNRASGDYSFVGAGANNVASGMTSVAFGMFNTSSATSSFATGMFNTASGQYSTVFGYGNTASGNDSFAGGLFSTSSGDLSFAYGAGVEAKAFGSIALGASMTVSSSYTFGLNIDPSNSAIVNTPYTIALMGGNVGISTTTPTSRLTIDNDGGILAVGTFGSGSTNIPSGAGTRMLWYPRKAAIRAGYVNGTQWNESNIGNYSVAFGNNNTANGQYSVVVGGLTNIASNTYSTVSGGRENTASGQYSTVAGGYYNFASGTYSFTAGYFNVASGEGSVALGTNMSVTGVNSIALNATGVSRSLSQNNTIALFGNVGINTGTPGTNLTVAGNELVTGNFTQLNTGYVSMVSTTRYGAGAESKSFISGNYAYVVVNGTTNNFVVIDISRPASPKIVTTTSLGSGIYPIDIYVSGKYAYVVARSTSNNLKIVDISNPTVPFVVSTLTVDSKEAMTIFVSGKYAYIGFYNTSGNDTFKIVDISNPYLPVVKSNLAVDNIISDIYVSGKYAYITAFSYPGWSGKFLIADISDPLTPVLVSTVSTNDVPSSVYISGRYAYITHNNFGGGTDNRMRIMDISNPAAPSTVSSFIVDDTGMERPKDIYVSGRYAYMVVDGDTTYNKLYIIDVSNPSSPAKTFSGQACSPYSTYGGAYYIKVSGKYAYVNCSLGGMAIFDVSGTEVSALIAHSAEAGNLQIRNDLIVKGLGDFNNLSVGVGGILSNGSVSISATNTPNYFGGSVGIGTTTPSYPLTVTGDVNITGAYRINGTAVTSSQWGTNGSNIYYNAGSVGIGTSTPLSKLHVDGGGLLITGTTGATPISGAGTRLMWVPSKGAFRAGAVDGNQWDDANIGNQSVAFGSNNIAIGNQSFAGGLNNTASGSQSFAFGNNNWSEGSGDFIIGSHNTSTGGASFVSGQSNKNSGIFSFIAGGFRNIITETGAIIAGGNDNTNSGQGSFIGGSASNTISGVLSFVGGGYEHNISGNWSFVGGGWSNDISGTYSAILGSMNSQILSTSSFVGGGISNYVSGNYSFIGGGESNTVTGTRSFIAGGIGNTIGSNNSFIGAGDGSSVYGLGSVAFGKNMVVNGSRSFGISLGVGGGQIDDNSVMAIMGGKVGIGTTTPDVELVIIGGLKVYSSSTDPNTYGYVDGDGFWQSSDISLKKNIVDFTGGLDKVMAMRPVGYEFKNETDNNGTTHIGFIAQEMENVVPQIVNTSKDGLKVISYGSLTPILVKAIQEQQEQIEALKKATTTLTVESTNSTIVYTVDMGQDMLGRPLLNVASIIGANNKWEIDTNGLLKSKVSTSEGDKEIYGLTSEGVEITLSGNSQLQNGEAVVTFVTSTSEIIDDSQPMKVSITLTADEPVITFVKEKSARGFIVKQAGGGSSNATFDWIVIAKRKFTDPFVEGIVSESEPESSSPLQEDGQNETIETSSSSPVVEASSTEQSVEEPLVETGIETTSTPETPIE